MRNSSGEEKIWRASRPFLFGFTVFFSCVLASFAAAQTSAGGREESNGSSLQGRSSEGTLPGTMTVNPNGTLVGASVFAGRHWVSHSRENPGAVTLATHYDNAFSGETTFPESTLTTESVLAQEVTPVSEPGTWIVAALVAAFLMWKSRKSLMTLLNRLPRYARGSPLARDEKVAQLTNVSTRAVIVSS
jgi:hypothetical protein